ncbi:MAG: carbon-nitrogen hydrolase family protein [Gemmatimonadota bacterium]
MDQAAADRPDIVCLPETFGKEGVAGATAASVAEPVPGPTTEMAMERARRYGTYVICPLIERRGEVLYNSAVVIDRQGQIAGTYEKLHPVTTTADFTAFEDGITPGREPKVFDLDFGRIGILICFDIQWAREWARLGEMGAEVVFWPSAYDGGFPLQARAWDHHYWVVSSVQTQKSRIVDITGEVLLVAGARTPVIGMEIDLEKRYFHTDFNASQTAAIKAKYGREVTVRLYHDEGGMTVECHREGLTVEALMAEFDLELVPDYVARHDLAEVATRAGRRPDPQPPRRVRGQWV